MTKGIMSFKILLIAFRALPVNGGVVERVVGGGVGVGGVAALPNVFQTVAVGSVNSFLILTKNVFIISLYC